MAVSSCCRRQLTQKINNSEINENFFYLLYKAVSLLRCNCNHCSNVVKHLCAVDTNFPRFSLFYLYFSSKFKTYCHAQQYTIISAKNKKKKRDVKSCNFAFIMLNAARV